MGKIRDEFAGSINGVPGRFHNVITFEPTERIERARGRIANQQWVSESRPISGYGPGGKIQVFIRHDDNCKNGHESFAITANVTTNESRGRRDIQAGGCLHDDIEKVFPELAPLIKWHLCDVDGPLHYVANTCYHASDRDHNGLRKGERRQIRNGRTGQLAWHLVAVIDGAEKPLHELPKYHDGETPPDETPGVKWAPWCIEGEGKPRDFAAARSCAIWPEATDEQLSLPRKELAALLAARLPALLADFRAAVEGAGFIWSGVQS